MKWPVISTAPGEAVRSPLRVRLLWMAAIWSVSVLALLAVAWVLRLVLGR